MSEHYLTIAGTSTRLDIKPGKVYVLGKDPEADLVLDEGAFTAKKHAEVELVRAHIVIRPLAIAGTYVNGKRVTEGQKLQPNDKIKIGKQTIVVDGEAAGEAVVEDEGAGAATAEAERPAGKGGDADAFAVLESLGEEPAPGAAEAAPAGAAEEASGEGRARGGLLGGGERRGGGGGAGGGGFTASAPAGERKSFFGGRRAGAPAPEAPPAGRPARPAAARPAAPAPKDDWPVIAHYEILSEFPDVKGGRAFHARVKADGTDIVLKVLDRESAKDEALSERFTREALALRRLAHPNIVRIRSAGKDAGQLYYATEFVSAQTLAELLKKGPLELKTALSIGIQIANALVLAHGVQVIHRDISPSSIVVTDQGIAKLYNFAFVKNLGDDRRKNVTALHEIVGDIAYSAPELVSDPRSATPSCDLYSLGATLYHAISGKPPYTGRNQIELLRVLMLTEPARLEEAAPACPAPVAELVMRLLAKDPAARPQTADEVVAALHEALAAAAALSEKAAAEGPDLSEFSAESIAQGLGGEFKGMELVELIQFFELTKKTGTLKVDGSRFDGEMFFRDGSIVGARVAGETGEAAATAILVNPAGRFLFRAHRTPDPLPLEDLRIKPSVIAVDVMRKLDEAAGGGEGGLDAPPE
jgi:hypothetical protein